MSMFGPLAWPLATVVLALLFRKDVGHAMGRVGQFKYRDLELTFREDLHQAEQLARSIRPPAALPAVMLEASTDQAEPLGGRLIVSPSKSKEPIERPDPPVEVAERRPREAIEAAWGVLARAQAKQTECGRGRLNRSETKLVGLLRDIKDRSAQFDQAPPTTEDARRFVALANRVAARIEELG